MTSKPEADARLVAAHDLAIAALHEITPASTVGSAAGYFLEDDGSVSLRFANLMPGYPGWFWTVTVARVEDEDPTVLEVELLPGDGALLAPDWVPWTERLAEYRAHQVELAEQAAADAVDADAAAVDTDDSEDSDVEDEEDAVDDDDLDDDEEDGELSETRVLHAGDLDGVDIDELDDSTEVEYDDDSESEADEDSDDDSEADEEE